MVTVLSVNPGQKFLFKGQEFEIDQYGSYGSRQVPIINVVTKQKDRIPANTKVELVTETTEPIVEEPPVVEDSIVEPEEPELEEFYEPHRSVDQREEDDPPF